MLGTLPPAPASDRPELPRVRLEVRAGTPAGAAGRTPPRSVSYEVGGDEFLIGGTGGCDLRLPTPGLPPVIAQISRKPDAVRVRRLTPVLPVLLNGSPLAANAPTAVSSGDVLTLAGVEITVNLQPSALISAKFVPVAEEPPAVEHLSVPVPPAPPVSPFPRPDPDDLYRRDAELIRRARDLDIQTEELEADRAIWYRRRQEMEAEFERHRAMLGDAAARAEVLDARERELNRVRDEFDTLRQKLFTEYQERREELAGQQEALAEANARTQADRAAAEADAARRRAEFDADVAQHEPKLREVADQQNRLAAAFQELSRQRDLFAADREILDRARGEFDAGRVAENERLAAWEAALAGRESDLAQRATAFEERLAAFDRDRTQFQDDLVRLERRTAALEEQERRTGERTREVDARHEQLRQESVEWEETIRLATAEQERLRDQAVRLDRQRAELDAQSATLTERAGQLEAQQAVLAVLRSKLDRTRQDAEREAVQLATARTREEQSLAELRTRIREAEELRVELATVQQDTVRERNRLEERDSLLAAGLEEIRSQRDGLAAEAARLQAREAELDVRSAEFAEQAGTLKGRMTQAVDLQSRLEADRVAVREREAALTQSEDARQALQEQLRRRAEDLTARAKTLDEVARQVAADRAALEQAREAIDAQRAAAGDELNDRARQLAERSAEVERLAAEFAEKEHALARQVARLRDVGATVAAERKSLAELRAKWESDRTAAAEADAKAREELEAFRARAMTEIEILRTEAPELESQATAAFDKLASARDMLRGHLTELHDFARLSREDLAAIRTQVRQEAERLRDQEEALNRAKAEHRLAVTAFRQQLIDWQGQVTEMKRTLAGSESRLDAKQEAVERAAKQVDATTVQLAEQAERLRLEREAVSERRTEVERHLTDMREWYRKKLRELAGGNAGPKGDGAIPRPRLADTGDDSPEPRLADSEFPGPHSAAEELDPGDRQLGELLRSHALVDGDTLAALWAEAGRQRKTLRQVLLASGAVTLYQLALIEAGNLDALMVGRFRVIDRLRVTPREAIYRVLDPARPDEVFLLRHLSEAEMHDAVHPDEFRQRFATARDAAHPNLAGVTEVLEIAGRPAAVQPWLTGLFSADWPAHAANPGCWVRLATMAASGIDAAHRHGLAHGRLTPDSFILTPDGSVKVSGFGEPQWLGAAAEAGDADPAGDLRAFGRVLFAWSQLAAKQKKPGKPKPFPEALLSIVRRLEADPEPPMADTVAAERPYESAAEVVADLNRVARTTAFSDDAWEKLLKHVEENAPDAPAGLKRSA